MRAMVLWAGLALAVAGGRGALAEDAPAALLPAASDLLDGPLPDEGDLAEGLEEEGVGDPLEPPEWILEDDPELKEFKEIYNAAKRAAPEAKPRRQEWEVDAAFRAGERHYREGEYLKARAAFETVRVMDPAHAAARTFLRDVARRLEEQAADSLRLAREALRLNKDEAAYDLAQAALSLRPGDPDVSAFLEQAPLKGVALGRDAARAKRGAELDLLVEKAESLEQGGDLAGALREALAVLKEDPSREKAKALYWSCRHALADRYLEAGRTFYAKGDWREAKRRVDQAVLYHPGWEPALTLQAELTQRGGDGGEEPAWQVEQGENNVPGDEPNDGEEP